MTSLSEYLSSLVINNSSYFSKSEPNHLNLFQSQIEAKIKQALSYWKWNHVSSDQKQLTSFLRACDGLWSDRYGDKNKWNEELYSSKNSHTPRDDSWKDFNQPWSFTFERESWLRVISAQSAGDSRVFVLVEMPKKLFVASDILHWRYHDKRKIFLAVVGWCLVKSGYFDSVEIVAWAIGKPLLQLRLDKQWDIVLFPCTDVFQSEHIFKKKIRAWNSHSDVYYMTTILEDLLLDKVFQHVTFAEESHSEMKHAVDFLRYWFTTWHRKRDSSSDDVFLMSIWFIMYCRITTKDMHWKRLDFIRLVEYFFHLFDSQMKDILQGSLLQLQQISPLVYLCPLMNFIPSKGHQLDYRVYGDLYHLWKGIQYTNRCFDISTCFQSNRATLGDWMLCTAFPREPNSESYHPLLGLWDMFISLELSFQGDRKMLNYLSLYGNCYWILYQALWKRCVYISVIQMSIRESSGSLLLGCRLNPQNAFVTTEKATNEQEKEHFRSFWKEKCELRRYRDGNTYDSVIWKEDDAEISLQSLFHRICHYALDRNLPSVKGEQIQIFCDLLESSLLPNNTSSSLPWVAGFNRLANWLRKLEDLPFDIHNICVASDMFRGTSVILPDVWMNQAIFQYIDAPRAIIIIEGNMQWSQDDREAQKMMRIGYYLVLKRCLQDQGMESCADEHGLDVVFEDYIYHFEIWMHQEYQQAMNNEHRDTAIAIQLHYHLKHMTEKETIQSSFRNACRLAKRWLSCHLFSDYFSDEMIELLVARAYLYEMGSLDGDIPCSGFSGFYHFLYVLSLFATQMTAIVVPIPNHSDDDSFIAKDNIHSPFRFFQDADQISRIYSQEHAHSFYWKYNDNFLYPLYRSAQGIPEWPVLKRIGQVAKATYKTLEQRILMMSPNDNNKWNVDSFKILFRPDVSIYDVLIVIHKKYLSRVKKYSLESVGKRKYPPAKSIPLDALYVNFDPLEYFVQQLRDKFGTFALFFYDKYGGYQVGILWKPVTRTFSLNHMPFMKPEQGQLQVNYDEILYEIRQMGGPWIKQIKLRDKSFHSSSNGLVDL